jgi:tetratricopeptide (TPR) repeat protein
MNGKHKLAVTLFVAAFVSQARADLDGDIAHLQQRWAEVNYQLEGKIQLTEFDHLVEEAKQVTAMYPNSAESWIWSGIIKSTYAGAKSGLGALSLAKESKADLEKAMTLNDHALEGSAYTSMGTLYYSVPGWPVGFGDDDKAEELLQKALALNPNGIDSNYFYGSYLITEKRYDEARQYLHKAQMAPPRPNRQLADEGRQQEIFNALAEIDGK